MLPAVGTRASISRDPRRARIHVMWVMHEMSRCGPATSRRHAAPGGKAAAARKSDAVAKRGASHAVVPPYAFGLCRACQRPPSPAPGKASGARRVRGSQAPPRPIAAFPSAAPSAERRAAYLYRWRSWDAPRGAWARAGRDLAQQPGERSCSVERRPLTAPVAAIAFPALCAHLEGGASSLWPQAVAALIGRK